LQYIIYQNHAYADQRIHYVKHDLRGETVRDLWFLDEDDALSDGVHVEGDDPRRSSDEEVDKP
jgi:hypothetical protein